MFLAHMKYHNLSWISFQTKIIQGAFKTSLSDLPQRKYLAVAAAEIGTVCRGPEEEGIEDGGKLEIRGTKESEKGAP